MKRGDLVTVVARGGFGKPRPALVIQADLFAARTTVAVLPLTSTLVDAPLLRVTIEPNSTNHVRRPSQVVVDKTIRLRRDKLGPAFGTVDADTLLQVERCLAVFFGNCRVKQMRSQPSRSHRGRSARRAVHVWALPGRHGAARPTGPSHCARK